MRLKIKIAITALIVGLGGSLAVASAYAQVGGNALCTSRKEARERLAFQYKEAPVNMGLAANGAIIEVFATEDGSSFTIILTMPDGTTCMMVAGESWESLIHKLPRTGSGT